MNKPLYITGTTPSGEPLIGGIFRMRDEQGFPLEDSVNTCNQKGWKVDWLEAMADCWLNDCLKFDNFVKEASLLCPGLEDKFKTLGATIIAHMPHLKQADNPVDEVCRNILKEKGKIGG